MVGALLRLFSALLLALLIAPDGVHAASAGHDESGPSGLCLAAMPPAERRYDTPPGLLAVMAKVESGRATPPTGALQPWPWTVDADGEGIFFATKAQAVAWSRQALDSGAVTFLDVGCMQVDLRMHPHAFATLEEAFDPAANTDYGARFLRELHGCRWQLVHRRRVLSFAITRTGGGVSRTGRCCRGRSATAAHALWPSFDDASGPGRGWRAAPECEPPARPRAPAPQRVPDCRDPRF
jgi:hypothetical protein